MSREPARRAWDHRGRGPPSPPCARRSAPAHQRPRARAKQASPPSSGWEGDWAGLGTGWGPCVGWGTAWSPWTGACPGWVCGSQSFRVSLERQPVPRRNPSVKSRQCACTVPRSRRRSAFSPLPAFSCPPLLPVCLLSAWPPDWAKCHKLQSSSSGLILTSAARCSQMRPHASSGERLCSMD